MTAEAPNFVRVAPSPANGNGNMSGSAADGLNAQPRAGARARGGKSVSKALAVPAERQPEAAAPDVPSLPATDRPDAWRRAPLPLSAVWERAFAEVSEWWSKPGVENRALAAVLLVYAMFAIAVSGLAYFVAFSAQTWPRALWLIVGVASLGAFLFAGGEPAPVATP